MKVPRDLVVCFAALFSETYIYFLFSYLLMPYFIHQVHLSNVQSGFIYAAFGGILLFMSIFFGSVIDKLLLRKTLLLQLAVGMTSMLLMSLSTHVIWTCIVLFGPVTFGLAIGLPAIPVAVRRYTTLASQTMGFGILFVVMNLGTEGYLFLVYAPLTQKKVPRVRKFQPTCFASTFSRWTKRLHWPFYRHILCCL
jgi:predicted MFS family arabinose efflux permease